MDGQKTGQENSGLGQEILHFLGPGTGLVQTCLPQGLNLLHIVLSAGEAFGALRGKQEDFSLLLSLEEFLAVAVIGLGPVLHGLHKLGVLAVIGADDGEQGVRGPQVAPLPGEDNNKAVAALLQGTLPGALPLPWIPLKVPGGATLIYRSCLLRLMCGAQKNRIDLI